MNIKAVNKRMRISGVAERYKNVQYNDRTGEWSYGKEREEIYNKLKSLPITADNKDVDLIIGNDSWTSLTCEICGRSRDSVAILESEHGEIETSICESCLSVALYAINNLL